MNFEETFRKIGEFGTFQKLLLLAMSPYPLLHAMQQIGWNFMAPDHSHWCEVQELNSYSHDQQKYISIPYTPHSNDNMYDSCQVFNLLWKNYTKEHFDTWNRSVETKGISSRKCESWIYGNEFGSTIRSEFDLVCDEAWLPEVIATLFIVGLFIGSVLSGILSDAFGRRRVLIVFVFLTVATNLALAFSPKVLMYAVFHFLMAITTRCATNCSFVLGAEFCGSKARVLSASNIGIQSGIGAMLMGLSGYLLGSFRYIHLLIALLYLVTGSYIFILPESPRWLFSKDRSAEAFAILRRVAKVNKRVTPFADSSIKDEIQIKQLPFKCVLQSKILCRYALILFMGWTTSSLLHMSMTLSISQLAGEVHTNVIISGAVELILYVIAYFIAKHKGRKIVFMGSYLLASMASFVTIPFDMTPGLEEVAAMLSLICRGIIAPSTTVLFVLSAELFPGSVRQRTLGYCGGFATAIATAAPFMGYSMRDIWRPLPNIIFGTMGLFCGLLGWWLPETIHASMPESMEDAENLNRGQNKQSNKIWTISNGNGQSLDKHHENNSGV